MTAPPHKPISPIGSKELVDFPDLGLTKVPARVDTGAAGSAIWASDIRVENGQLSFSLFAPGSALHREEVLTSDAYRTTVVKNSFGDTEFRYMIRLRIRLGSRTVRCWFSLADRSNNTYPVLLGRNFLRGRFVVDVTQHYVHDAGDEARRVLVFTREVPETTAFFRTVQAQNRVPVTYDCVPYESLLFHVNGAATTVRCTVTGRDISQYDFTYLKNHHDHEPAYASAMYLKFKGRPFADREFVTFLSGSKLSEYMKLTCHGLPVPQAVGGHASLLLTRFSELRELLGVPFVLKAAASDKGRDNYIVDDEATYSRLLHEAEPERLWLAQRYIPNDGFYRVHVLGKEVDLAVWRASAPHENPLKRHLNKPRGSANAQLIPLTQVPGEVQQLALQAASYMNRQIAGVDLVQDKITRKWYILEANNDPQIRSGSFVAEKTAAIASFFDKELGR
ncbi:MAG TPA: RimK/LysX family protein [Candidatus Saccharimonadales bacterium]|nr:RimK/LysX family protein [Candidatus Saccharimonadales bacterium]